MREELRGGLDYLDAVTTLLQRVRSAHPTHGLYQAAELQWWWSGPRSTDRLGQLFWFDDLGRPAAAFLVTDFGDGSSAVYEDPTLVVVVSPSPNPHGLPMSSSVDSPTSASTGSARSNSRWTVPTS